MVYGIGDIAADVTTGMREREKEKKQYGLAEAREQRDVESHEQRMTKGQEQLKRYRNMAKAEGMDSAVKLLLSGRLQDAETMFNSVGEHKIKPGSLKYDRKTGRVNWTEIGPEGEEIPAEALDRHLAAVSGVRWGDYTGKGTGTTSAKVQYFNRLVGAFGGDEKKAIMFLDRARRDPSTAVSTVFKALKSSQDKDIFASDEGRKISDEELWMQAKEMVSGLQEESMQALYGDEEGSPEQPAPEAVPTRDTGYSILRGRSRPETQAPTATHPDTGEQVIWKNGKWQPLQ
jgi:hypothetical protein